MNEPRRYRKRPLEVSAIQWTGDNFEAVWDFYREAPGRAPFIDAGSDGSLALWVEKISQPVTVPAGTWIIAELDGVGMYPCTAAMFEAIYEEVE